MLSTCSKTPKVPHPTDAPVADAGLDSNTPADLSGGSSASDGNDVATVERDDATGRDGFDDVESVDQSRGESGSLDWSAACSAYARALCERMAACEVVVSRQLLGDVDDCVERLGGENCVAEMSSNGVTLTPAAVGACATGLAAQDCVDHAVGYPPECRWRGSLVNQSPCTWDAQCQSGWCNIRSDAWCGTCQPKLAADRVCPIAGGTGCEDGMVCAITTCSVTVGDAGVCHGTVQTTCTKPKPTGSPCLSRQACVWGDGCSAGQCAPWKELGDECDGYVCNLEKNELCLNGQDGGSARCTAVTYASVGQNCDLPATSCSGSSTCTGWNGTPGSYDVCTPAAEDGAPCDVKGDCRYPSKCIGGKCRTAAQVAASCD